MTDATHARPQLSSQTFNRHCFRQTEIRPIFQQKPNLLHATKPVSAYLMAKLKNYADFTA